MNRYKVFQVLSMFNVHPYFSLKNLGKMYALYTAKYGKLNIPTTNFPILESKFLTAKFLSLAK